MRIRTPQFVGVAVRELGASMFRASADVRARRTVDVVDEHEIARIDHIPLAIDRERIAEPTTTRMLPSRKLLPLHAGRPCGAAVDLTDASRAGETLGEVRDVLTDQVALGARITT